MANNIKHINLNSSETQSDGVKIISLSDTGAGGGSSDVFVATYGSTTYNEVIAANTAGKIVMMANSDEFGILVKITASLAYFFHYQNGRRIKLYTLQSNDSWGVSENFVPENEANKVSTISGNETDTTKYLNCKGVYDFVKALADANGLTMP